MQGMEHGPTCSCSAPCCGLLSRRASITVMLNPPCCASLWHPRVSCLGAPGCPHISVTTTQEPLPATGPWSHPPWTSSGSCLAVHPAPATLTAPLQAPCAGCVLAWGHRVGLSDSVTECCGNSHAALHAWGTAVCVCGGVRARGALGARQCVCGCVWLCACARGALGARVCVLAAWGKRLCYPLGTRQCVWVWHTPGACVCVCAACLGQSSVRAGHGSVCGTRTVHLRLL